MNIRLHNTDSADNATPRRWAGIKYLNAYPLIRGLEEDLPDWQKLVGTPAECASLLDSGRADIALTPLITAVSENWPFLGDIGIACHGPVTSVKLVHHTSLKHVKTYRPDAASGTSNVLARLIYNLEFGRDIKPDSHSEDAEIVIGDRAFETDTADHVDLGEAWQKETGLPFVFGVWAARDESILQDLGPTLIARLGANLEEKQALVREASRLTGKLINIEDYLYNKLRYNLSELDLLGMKTFVDLAYEYGLIPTNKMRMTLTQPVATV